LLQEENIKNKTDKFIVVIYNLSQFTHYEAGSSGKCPHCQHIVFFNTPRKGKIVLPTGGIQYLDTKLATESEDEGEKVFVYSSQCPNCKKPIVVAKIEIEEKPPVYRLVHPFNVVRTAPSDVPEEIREDFLEAAAVLPVSEKASAALSRRCLQHLLTERGYKGKDLNEQIEKVVKDLPPRIAENLDAVRVIGNFAAHPIKSKQTGLIVDVEPEEANWTLDVLEELFEYFYVQPKKAEEKRKRLEEKLKEIGKPPLKKP
jgi:ssDNA-binding Zn-finger/Zn-ribbon topoisomerase 1